MFYLIATRHLLLNKILFDVMPADTRSQAVEIFTMNYGIEEELLAIFDLPEGEFSYKYTSEQLAELAAKYIWRVEYAGDGQGFTICSIHDTLPFQPIWCVLGYLSDDLVDEFLESSIDGLKSIDVGKKRTYMTNCEMQNEFHSFMKKHLTA